VDHGPLTLIGTSSILGAINFLVTIFRMRAPGMTLFGMLDPRVDGAGDAACSS